MAGYDVHRLTEGRRMILGGVEIHLRKGLAGSFRRRPDIAYTHAVMDSLLGAAAWEEILAGIFPDSDPLLPGRRQPGAAETGMSFAEKKNYHMKILTTILAQRPEADALSCSNAENLARHVKFLWIV